MLTLTLTERPKRIFQIRILQEQSSILVSIDMDLKKSSVVKGQVSRVTGQGSKVKGEGQGMGNGQGKGYGQG